MNTIIFNLSYLVAYFKVINIHDLTTTKKFFLLLHRLKQNNIAAPSVGFDVEYVEPKIELYWWFKENYISITHWEENKFTWLFAPNSLDMDDIKIESWDSSYCIIHDELLNILLTNLGIESYAYKNN